MVLGFLGLYFIHLSARQQEARIQQRCSRSWKKLASQESWALLAAQPHLFLRNLTGFKHTYVYKNICACVYIYTYVYTYVYIYYTYAYKHIYKNIYIYVYTGTYIHTLCYLLVHSPVSCRSPNIYQYCGPMLLLYYGYSITNLKNTSEWYWKL